MNRFRLALLLPAILLLPHPGRAAEPKLSVKHGKAGLTCLRCHGEEKPTRPPASDDSCIACHGDLPAVAAETQGLTVNPHQVPKGGHRAPGTCISCHFEHRTPVATCLECHPKFKFTPR